VRSCLKALLPLSAMALGLVVAGGPALAGPADTSQEAVTAAPRPVVKGAILDRYRSLGGARGFLGVARTSETPTPYRPGAYNEFQGGSIYWSPGIGAWEVHGDIRSNWAALGYENSGLGFPKTNEMALPGGAAYNAFENGLSYYAPGLGAHEVRGAIGGAYDRLGRERGRLGFPVTNEQVAPDGTGRYSVFQRGSVYWTPVTGAFEVEGAIFAKWGSLGWENSALGYPVSDEYDVRDGAGVVVGRASDFQGGIITWTPQTGAIVTTSGGVVSAVDKVQEAFAIDDLQQGFRYDDNDVFGSVTIMPDGSVGNPMTLTKTEFTAKLDVDSLVGFAGYSLDPAGVSTFVIIEGDLPSGSTASGLRSPGLKKALQSLQR